MRFDKIIDNIIINEYRNIALILQQEIYILLFQLYYYLKKKKL